MPYGAHEPGRGGLLGSAGRLLDTVISILGTRLELASIELQEEGVRLVRIVVLACLALLSLVLTLLLLTLLIVVVFWDTHRLEALGAATALYFALTLICVWMLRRRACRRAPLLAATVAELRKDCERLGMRR